MNGQTGHGQACALCAGDGGELVWRDGFAHVVLADEPDYPGFTRVILDAHLAEMTDLAPASRERLMALVFRVEQVQREVLRPDKINLASFGNMVAHLHWHVIPRWRDDRHFPQPVWGAPAGRDAQAATRVETVGRLLADYRVALRQRLGAGA
jgi:diadenosine tetraphosphate (Ap4A) HIT family hydrolase